MDMRVQRGWIIVAAARGDDGRLVAGAGETRLSPFDALREPRADIPASAILKASVQRLAFWRR